MTTNQDELRERFVKALQSIESYGGAAGKAAYIRFVADQGPKVGIAPTASLLSEEPPLDDNGHLAVAALLESAHAIMRKGLIA